MIVLSNTMILSPQRIGKIHWVLGLDPVFIEYSNLFIYYVIREIHFYHVDQDSMSR
jgi:hypothetical protein